MIPSEVAEHLKESGRETLRAVKAACETKSSGISEKFMAILPTGTRHHLEKARTEFLMAIKVAVDAALEEEAKPKKSRTRKVKVD